jgi:hypothetical protein
MTVAIPLARFDMDLDVPANHLAVEGKNGIFEITAPVVTDSARVYCLKSLAIIGNQIFYWLALPEAGNEFF